MSNMLTEKPTKKNRSSQRRIPQELIYEMVDGKPIYYRDYGKVLTNETGAEEIMGSSFLQAQLVALLVSILFSKLDLHRYIITTNEIGFIYAPKSWKVLDIAIFERKHLKDKILSTKYVRTVPKIVIEIDTKADVKKSSDIFSYVSEKTEHLLDSGVEKVIWILTDSQKVLVAEQGKQWLVAKWNDRVSVLDDVTIQLDQLVNTLVSGENAS